MVIHPGTDRNSPNVRRSPERLLRQARRDRYNRLCVLGFTDRSARFPSQRKRLLGQSGRGRRRAALVSPGEGSR
jgi:hypothetical protein